MTFSIFRCPGCGRRTLADEVGATSYCMYCGDPLSEKDFDEPLDAMMETTLRFLIECEEPEESPMAGEVAEAADLLMSGDAKGAAEAFAGVLEGRTPEEANGLKDAMAAAAARWILEGVLSNEPYSGGLLDIAPLLVVDGAEDTTPQVLVEGIFNAMHEACAGIMDSDGMHAVLCTEYALLCDYMETEPSICNQGALAEEFWMRAKDVEGEHADIDAMAEAASCLMDAMDAALEEMGDEALDEAEAFWTAYGIGSIGGLGADALRAVAGRSFEDAREDVERAAKAYADAYRARGNQ
ncbi:MAG: hypothetical protein Q4Q62_07465 [Thermoplasmata archaeon]|nr:hypothetical protein [Thermoplasmata archaeon]